MYWFAEILVLPQLRVPLGNVWSEDYGFIQYIDITEPVDEVDLALHCVYLRCH